MQLKPFVIVKRDSKGRLEEKFVGAGPSPILIVVFGNIRSLIT